MAHVSACCVDDLLHLGVRVLHGPCAFICRRARHAFKLRRRSDPVCRTRSTPSDV